MSRTLRPLRRGSRPGLGARARARPAGLGTDAVDGPNGSMPAPSSTSRRPLGGATFERSVNYAAPPANSPDLGTSYFYSTPKKMVITVQVFDGGRRVPAGSDNPTVIGEFGNETRDRSKQQIKGSGYTNFQKPAVPSSCSYGAVTFRCITYSAVTQANMRVYSKLLLTGYQQHFVKIRIDWGQCPGCSRPAPMPMPPCRPSSRRLFH